MKSLPVVAAIVCVVLTAGAWAQGFGGRFDARQLGMGGLSVAIDNGASQWSANPGGIALPGSYEWAHRQQPAPPIKWNGALLGAVGSDARENTFEGFTYTGFSTSGRWGLGAGWGQGTDEGSGFGLGAGCRLGRDFGVGFDWQECDPDYGDQSNVINFGVLYQQPKQQPLRIGLIARDVFNGRDDSGVFDLGFAYPVDKRLILGLDVLDLGNKFDAMVNFGMQWTVNTKEDWKLRAGLLDDGRAHRLTAGAGYVDPKGRWFADFGYANTEPSATWEGSVGYHFGSK